MQRSRKMPYLGKRTKQRRVSNKIAIKSDLKVEWTQDTVSLSRCDRIEQASHDDRHRTRSSEDGKRSNGMMRMRRERAKQADQELRVKSKVNEKVAFGGRGTNRIQIEQTGIVYRIGKAEATRECRYQFKVNGPRQDGECEWTCVCQCTCSIDRSVVDTRTHPHPHRHEIVIWFKRVWFENVERKMWVQRNALNMQMNCPDESGSGQPV